MMARTQYTTLYDRARAAAAKEGIRGMGRSAREWYRVKIQQLGNRYTPTRTLEEHRRKDSRPQIGRMYFYMYDPKHKDKLKYYDTFPLTIVIARYKDGFLGLNLHYLPPKSRGIFLSKLLQIQDDTKMTDNRKLQVTYAFLRASAKYKEFEPCLHRYLYSQLKSVPARVEPNDWMLSIFLPVARFKKARNSRVWGDSMRKLT